MKNIMSILVFIVLLFFHQTSVADGECTVEVSIQGVIGLSNYQRILSAKKKAVRESCPSILVLLNTPGGSLETTRKIVTEILNSNIPFLCLVYPSGAHAGSAGAIILQACHVSGAMGATNIGAATPITGTGQDAGKDLRKKLINDTTSWLQGITQLRKRNRQFGEDIITKAKALSATEALKIGAIDFMASTKIDFLRQSSGKKVVLKDSLPGTVQTGDLIATHEGLKEKALDLLADPQLSYMMFMASLGLLYFELTHPGMMAPGVIGAVGLVVSMISLHKLDVQWGALLLILLGLGFLIAEAFVPSFGMLGVGGGVALFLGSLFLFDSAATGYSLPLSMILPTALAFTFFSLLIARLAFRSRNYKSKSNQALLLESSGRIVQVKSGGEYWVEVNGERWKANSQQVLQEGDEVKIEKIENLLLKVTKIN